MAAKALRAEAFNRAKSSEKPGSGDQPSSRQDNPAIDSWLLSAMVNIPPGTPGNSLTANSVTLAPCRNILKELRGPRPAKVYICGLTSFPANSPVY